MSRFHKSALIASAAVIFSFGPAAWAQDADIDFGDDTSVWANDGECDDPRFEGTGMTATSLLDEDRGHDASDCRSAFNAGNLSLRAETTLSSSAAADKLARESGASTSSSTPISIPSDVNYGDDASVWANDGECDDPRFSGPNAVADSSRDNLGHDATDCRTSVEAGTATYSGELQPLFSGEYDGVNFGDNEGGFPADDECDDPRFSGTNVAIGANRVNAGHDAHDCRASYEAGTATYDGELRDAFVGEHDGVDFGDNAGGFPSDGECDDPRFSGDNVAFGAHRSNAGHDSDDCYASYVAGTATFNGDLAPAFTGLHDSVDFGDNEGSYPSDGECDDPRFAGTNVATGANRSNALHDSDDCYTSYLAGTATFVNDLEPLFEGEYDGVNFGDNSGPYVDDKECDDPRFEGQAMAASTQRQNLMRDSHDCQVAYVDGTVTYTGELEPLFTGTYDGIDFGDNEGPYIDDMECDDRRFRGVGMARPAWGADSETHDAADCHWMFQRGFVTYAFANGLIEGRYRGIDFGDNTGAYVNDGECDEIGRAHV